jgi:cyclophilin family peptidyl-prolyl cis-trans isomerase
MGKKSRQKILNRELKVQNQEKRKKKRKKFLKWFVIGVVIAALLGGGGFTSWKYYFSKKIKMNNDKKAEALLNKEIAVLDTNQGTIKIRLYRTAAPKTVENFVKLANEGFYDGTKFHRVIADFMIQGGDPLSRDETKINQWGSGGPGYKFDDEINPWAIGVDDQTIKTLQSQGYKYDKNLTSLQNLPGYVAMANSGPSTNGSQFFIITESPQTQLNGKHTVFGRVMMGMDVVKKIAAVKTNTNDRPIDDIVINKVTIETDAGEAVPAPDTASNSPAVNITPENGSPIQATTEDGTPINVQMVPVK